MEKSSRDTRQIQRWLRFKNTVDTWDDSKRARVSLKQKAKSHGIVFPSICEECGKTFRTDKALSSHKNAVHKDTSSPELLPDSPPELPPQQPQPTFTIDNIAGLSLQNLAEQILAKDYIVLEHQRNELQAQMQKTSKQKQEMEKDFQVRQAKLKLQIEQIEFESKIRIAESEKQIRKQEKLLKKKSEKFNDEKKKMTEFAVQQKGRVKLDVGGQCFSTSVSTLTKYPHSFFGAMFSGNYEVVKEEDGSIFIDRSPKYFEAILNYLRDGEVNLAYDENALDELLREVKFYQILPLAEAINKQLEDTEEK